MLCLALAGCTPTAETQMDEQRNPHYLAGKEKLGALDYKGAIESFERAVEDNPRSALAHFELGVLFEQREADYAAALYH
jgi:tetratricopeptide (TPR) repeat protein